MQAACKPTPHMYLSAGGVGVKLCLYPHSVTALWSACYASALEVHLEAVLRFSVTQWCVTEGDRRCKLVFSFFYPDIALSKQMGLTHYERRKLQVQSMSRSRGKRVLLCRVEEMSLSHCSSKPNHKLSKSSQPVPATGIIVLWFAHLFSIVHLGSPSMIYKTINSKGLSQTVSRFISCIGTAENRFEWIRKEQFSHCAFGCSFTQWLTCLHHHVHQIFSGECCDVQSRLYSISCHTVSGYYSYRRLMDTAKSRHKNVIISIDFFFFVCVLVEMDLSATERSLQANRKTCASTNDTLS